FLFLVSHRAPPFPDLSSCPFPLRLEIRFSGELIGFCYKILIVF
ncbi:hypothetical protein SDJN02_21761, partial [Cucurbita argyrosperma subsp. argyrosperma]